MKTMKIAVTGTTALMLNNPQTVNPFNEYSKALKPLTSKRSKTEEDLLEIHRLKFLASLYYENGTYVLPSEHFEQSIISAARERKLGRAFERSFYIAENSVLEFRDNDKTPEELFKIGAYVDIRAVGIKNSMVTTSRAIVPNWSTIVECSYDETQLDEKDIIDVFAVAGMRYGVGTYRRKFGKFAIKKIK